MNKRLFVTLSMAGLAMVAFGARKPKAAIKSSVKTVAIQQPTFTEWHDLQVNEINRLPLHTMHFAYDPNDFPGTGAEYLDKKKSMNYLSLEGTCPCTRFKRIKVAYLDASFAPREKSFSGFEAQIVQHEIDHCNGVVI